MVGIVIILFCWCEEFKPFHIHEQPVFGYAQNSTSNIKIYLTKRLVLFFFFFENTFCSDEVLYSCIWLFSGARNVWVIIQTTRTDYGTAMPTRKLWLLVT